MCAANHFVVLIPSLLLARSGLDSWWLFSGVFLFVLFFVIGVCFLECVLGGGGGGASLRLLEKG